MGRRARTPDRAIPEGRGGPASSAEPQERPSTPPAPEALLTFAEEFGRMLARQLLANPRRRRGYSLPAGMAGLAFNAVMVLLGYYMVTWLRR